MLSDEQVEERTAITIKLAQAAGQSVVESSNQLTAVWNNFYDGTQTLEHYGDVMAHLGAITASSTEEIAGGLEKFASIADMIGLSFDNAAAMLTTITAQTRQSEDVVGTALRTIFARLQGLQLGETLDDGTTLNKYSEALMTVGINIFDQNNQLKDMDDLIAEIGVTWKTLAKDQQVALAQTVAGVRQYNQLVALFDNYDLYESYVNAAQISDGALEKQSQDYARGWEAARDRVQAALETIYNTIIDDQFFIGMNNMFADVLDVVAKLIDGFGGVKGILFGLSGLMLQLFAKEMPTILSNLTNNIRTFVGLNKKAAIGVQQQAINELKQTGLSNTSKEFDVQVKGLEAVAGMKKQLYEQSRHLSAAQIEEYEAVIKITEAEYERLRVKAKTADENEKQLKSSIRLATSVGVDSVKDPNNDISKAKTKLQEALVQETDKVRQAFFDAQDEAEKIEDKINDIYYQEDKLALGKQLELANNKVEELGKKLQKLKKLDIDDILLSDSTGIKNLDELVKSYQQVNLNASGIEESLRQSGEVAVKFKNAFQEIQQVIQHNGENWQDTTEGKNALGNLKNELDALIQKVQTLSMIDTAGYNIEEAATASMDRWTRLAKNINDTTVEYDEQQQSLKELKQEVTKYFQLIQKFGNGTTIPGFAFADEKKKNAAITNLLQEIERWDGSDAEQVLAGIRGNITAIINSEFSGVNTGLDEAKAGLKAFFSTTEEGRRTWDELVKKIAQVSGLSVDYIEQMLHASKEIEQLPQKFMEWPETISRVSAALLDLGQTIQSVSNAIETFKDPESTLSDKLTAAGGAVTSVLFNLQGVGSAIKGIEGQILKFNAAQIATAANTGAVTKGFLGLGASTTSTIGTLGAATLTLLGVGAAIAAVGLAIYGLYRYFIVGKEIGNKYVKQTLENAQKTYELVDANQELSNSMRELINQYEDMNAAGEDTSEILDNIKEKLPELIQGYKDLAKEMNLDYDNEINVLAARGEYGNLTGDYTEFYEAQKNLDLKILKENISEQLDGVKAATTVLAMEMQDIQGKGEWNSSNYSLTVGDSVSVVDQLRRAFDWTTSAEDFTSIASINKTIDAVNSNEDIQKYISSSTGSSKRGRWYPGIQDKLDYTFTADTSNPEEFIEYYEALKSLQSDLEKSKTVAELNADDIYREISEMLVDTQEYYTGLVEQQDKYWELVGQAINLELEQSPQDFTTMDEYLNYRKEFIVIAQKEYGLSADRAKSYLDESTSLGAIAAKYKFAKTALKEFYNIDIQNLTEDSRTSFLNSIEQALDGMSDKEIQIALTVIPEVENINDLPQAISNQIIKANTLESMSQLVNIQTIFSDAADITDFSQSMLPYQDDDSFKAALEEAGMTFTKFQAETYENQLGIIIDFYHRIKTINEENVAINELLLEAQRAQYESQLSYLSSLDDRTRDQIDWALQQYSALQSQYNNLSDKDSEEAKELKQQLEDKAELFEEQFNIEIELANVSKIKNQIQQIEDELDDLNAKQVQINLSWTDTDIFKQQMQNIATLAQELKGDIQSIGDAYIFNNEQFRKWAQMYPELFSQAKLYTEGLISLDKQEVEIYLEGIKTKINETIDSKIRENNIEIDDLNAKKDIELQKLELIQARSRGEILINEKNSELVSSIYGRLLQYYIDQGYDQTEAHQKTLKTMGTNQEKYNQYLVDVSEKTAEQLNQDTEDIGDTSLKETVKMTSAWMLVLEVLENFGKMVNSIRNYEFIDAIDYGTKATDSFKKLLSGEYAKSTVAELEKSGQVKITAPSDPNSNNSWLPPMPEYTSGKYAASAIYQGLTTEEEQALETVYSEQKQLVYDSIELLQKQIDSLITKNTFLDSLRASSLEDIMDGATLNAAGFDDLKDLLEDTLERYHEINKELEYYNELLEQNNLLKDKAYGKNKLALMDSELEIIDKQIDGNERLLLAQKAALVVAKKGLTTYTKADGTEVNLFDEDAIKVNPDSGYLDNYTELSALALDEYNEAVKQYNIDISKITNDEDGSQKQALEDKLEDSKFRYEQQLEALKDYEEVNAETLAQETALQELRIQRKTLNYEKIQYKLELRIDFNELEAKEAEYYINKLSDDFYSFAEIGALISNTQIPLQADNLQAYEDNFNQLNQAFADNKINEADYIEGLQNSYDGILDNLEALQDLDKEMINYYGDTLKKAQEELSRYTDQIEHLNTVLDHYKSLIELINGEYDYNSMNTILKGIAKSKKDQLEVAEANYGMLLNQRQTIEEEMKAIEQGSAAWDVWDQKLQDIVQQTEEAEKEMLTATQEWAEALKAELENTYSMAAFSLEEAFTNGLGFDYIQNSMDRLSTYQNDYLTKTNQLYETNKLMRTAQQALDKTTNEGAKIKLKNYIAEANALGQQNKLSNLELEIQQAKYDLLLAEIALEESQNAKSVVRLQRDSEGNFGYVYTADQNSIAKAEQDLADAENALYNIRLEGANDNGQKLIELEQQLTEDLLQLEEDRANGRFNTETDYYAARDQLIKDYDDLFKSYSNLYAISMDEDARISQDAWVTAYQDIIDSAANWQSNTDFYITQCEEAYQQYRSVVENESWVVQQLLNNTAVAVENVTNKSEELKNKVKEEVIPELDTEILAVHNLTNEYAYQRDTIMDLIEYYEDLILKIKEAIQAQSGIDRSMLNSGISAYAPDYSIAMAQYLRSGGQIGDAQYSMYESLRQDKMNTEGFEQHLDTYNDINRMLYLYSVGNTAIREYVNEVLDSGGIWDIEKIKRLISIAGYDTGGYTGDWGPSGKLAVLHEKELVLNADDTNNLLSAVNLIRQITGSIDSEVARSMAFMAPNSLNIAKDYFNNAVEQNVHITAEFPVASDRNEIEEAFNNLINTAAQYANRART